MEIWPAIDIRGGKCVRLQQGDYDRETIYADDPVETAVRLVGEGAQFLHLVDLDGARAGRLVHAGLIQSIVRASGVPCELGGGIRDAETVAQCLDSGLVRVVIGTQAVKEPDWFRELCARFPKRLALGLDARDGWVATEGWRNETRIPAVELAKQCDGLPLAAIICTDIASDGMLTGPSFESLSEIKNSTRLPVVASGGVTSCDDIVRLAELPVAGCIIGRALYEGRLTLADALASVQQVSKG